MATNLKGSVAEYLGNDPYVSVETHRFLGIAKDLEEAWAICSEPRWLIHFCQHSNISPKVFLQATMAMADNVRPHIEPATYAEEVYEICKKYMENQGNDPGLIFTLAEVKAAKIITDYNAQIFRSPGITTNVTRNAEMVVAQWLTYLTHKDPYQVLTGMSARYENVMMLSTPDSSENPKAITLGLCDLIRDSLDWITVSSFLNGRYGIRIAQ